MVDIWDILTAIKTGVYNGENLISITQKIQQETNHGKQNDLKFHYLPCVLYNGVFSKKIRCWIARIFTYYSNGF